MLFSQKRNQMSKQGAIHRCGEDRISRLPDHLLCQILSNLPTKNAVKTSIFSTRWRNLWLSVPLLDLDIDDFTDLTTFLSFVSRFLDFSKDSCLHKLKISFQNEDLDMCSLSSWIEDAVMRKIQHLEIDRRMSFIVQIVPITLNLCETLVSLRLHFVVLHHFVFVSLPNLKVMHLEENIYSYAETLENLISSCPALEDLTVVRNVDEITEKVLRVRSQTLNSLNLVLDSSKSWSTDKSDNWEVFIDAPGLAYLSLKDDHSASFVIRNLGSSAKVDIAVSLNVTYVWDLDDALKRSAVSKLLTGLSSVRDMTISRKTLQIIYHYLKHEPMPQFCNMTRIHAKIYVSELEMLPDFLESCPNLKSLVLKLKGVTDKEEISFSSVPKCLQSSLEYVEMARYYCVNEVEMKLIKYILETSVVLKKFTLRVDGPDKEQESIIVTELVKFQRCSSACEVNLWWT